MRIARIFEYESRLFSAFSLSPLVLTALIFSTTQSAFAHGVKTTGHNAREQAALTRLWDMLISPARAAMNSRIADGMRFITADGLPDHATGEFPNRSNPNRIAKQNYEFRMPLQPRRTGSLVDLRRNMAFGVAINGVVFDPWTAEFWNNEPRSGYAYEALTGPYPLGLDRNNAHVQPDGAYHYHSVPVGIVERLAGRNTPSLIGYAADGFPIYGPMGYRDAKNAASGLIELRSGYRLKTGQRSGGPGGVPNGEFAQDYEHVESAGGLDVCNGREGVTPEYPEGTYYYVTTQNFPYIPRCFVGSPDQSFVKAPPPFGKGPPRGPPKEGFKGVPPKDGFKDGPPFDKKPLPF
ncbi:MAG: YHYH protein [Burkholderiales bacterium]